MSSQVDSIKHFIEFVGVIPLDFEVVDGFNELLFIDLELCVSVVRELFEVDFDSGSSSECFHHDVVELKSRYLRLHLLSGVRANCVLLRLGNRVRQYRCFFLSDFFHLLFLLLLVDVDLHLSHE